MRLLGWLVVALFWVSAAVVVAQDVTIHVVQRGETLFRIATRYGLTVDELAHVNSIANPSSIMVGQRLLIPTNGAAPVSTHTVNPGETLPSIAQLYGLTIEALVALNQLADPNTIYVGQVLTVTGSPETELTPVPTLIPDQGIVPTSVPAVAAQPSGDQPLSVIHTVQRGETLFRIATQYGIAVNDLARANSISDPTVIYAGQQLSIPGLTDAAEPLALDLPAPITGLSARPDTLIEGQTFRLLLTTSQPATVSATFLGRTLTAAADAAGTSHTILQGIPIFTSAGVYPLELIVNTDTTIRYTVNLQVLGGRYGSEYIQLMAGRDGLLDPALEQSEQTYVAGVMSQFTPERFFVSQMSLPAAATIISPFGTRRSYNGGAFDRYHSGTDFAGAPGTPVLAAAPGRVVLAETLNVRGLATIIDHGWGVYTGYWHQSQQYIQLGDFVNTGQVIGAIGSSGRVTGAHLHWELWVGGVAVDPMQWVRLSW